MSWIYKKLGEVCTIEKGNIGITKAVAGDFPLVALGEERRSHNEYQFDDDAVIVPLVSSTGHGHRSMKRIHFQSGKFAVGSILCALIPKNKSVLLAQFLYRFLDLNKEREFVSRMRGMANVTLPMKAIAEVEIPIPPIEVQEQIVERFYKIEGANQRIAIELEKQLTLLKKLRQQILQDAVQGKLLPQDPSDEPASILLERIKEEKERLIREKKIKKDIPLPPIKDEEIPFEIPQGWVWCRGDNIADFIDPQPSHRTPPEFNVGIPYVSMKDINSNGTINLNSARKVSPTILVEHQKRYSLKNGDFIFGKIGTIGKPIWLTPPFNYTLSANLILIQGKPSIINVRFLFYYLSSPIAEKHLYENKSEMSYPVFGMKKARFMPIPLPSISEQNRIVQKIERLMQICNNMEQTILQNQQFTKDFLGVALREALEPKETVEASKE
jgi:type I restriction enzyme S subunit